MFTTTQLSMPLLGVFIAFIAVASCKKKDDTAPSLARQISGMHHWYGGLSFSYMDTIAHQIPDSDFPITYINDSALKIDKYVVNYVKSLNIYVSGNPEDQVKLSFANDSVLVYEYTLTHAGGSYASGRVYYTRIK